MPDTKPFANFFSQNDFSKILENYQTLSFDMKSFFETQRKNIQALSEAGQMTTKNLRNIAERQTEFLSGLMQENSNIAREIMAEGTLEERFSKNADLFKNFYERNVNNMREIAEMAQHTNQEAMNLINKRVSATVNEIKSALEKSSAGKKAA